MVFSSTVQITLNSFYEWRLRKISLNSDSNSGQSFAGGAFLSVLVSHPMAFLLIVFYFFRLIVFVPQPFPFHIAESLGSICWIDILFRQGLFQLDPQVFVCMSLYGMFFSYRVSSFGSFSDPLVQFFCDLGFGEMVLFFSLKGSLFSCNGSIG